MSSWTDLLPTLAGVGSVYGAIDNASDIRDLGYGLQQNLEGMGNTLAGNTAFQGYGVTSGLGTSNVAADGSINLGVNPNGTHAGIGNNNLAGSQGAFNQAIETIGAPGQSGMDWNAAAQGQLNTGNGMSPGYGPYGQAQQQAMTASLADPSQRQSQIYNQLMAIQNPELDRQQAAQQAREYAMGRGGIRGSAYGGTAEDAAMAKARAQASNQAVLNAMQQADSERSMFGQMASQYGQLANQNYANNLTQQQNYLQNAAQLGQLGNQASQIANDRGGMLSQIGSAMGQLGIDQNKLSYLPMQMQMELLNQAQGTGGMAQTGQLTGQDYLAQLFLGGTEANINAQKVSSELMGNLYDSILDNLGGTSGVDGSSSGLLGGLGNAVDWIGSLFD